MVQKQKRSQSKSGKTKGRVKAPPMSLTPDSVLSYKNAFISERYLFLHLRACFFLYTLLSLPFTLPTSLHMLNDFKSKCTRHIGLVWARKNEYEPRGRAHTKQRGGGKKTFSGIRRCLESRLKERRQTQTTQCPVAPTFVTSWSTRCQMFALDPTSQPLNPDARPTLRPHTAA